MRLVVDAVEVEGCSWWWMRLKLKDAVQPHPVVVVVDAVEV